MGSDVRHIGIKVISRGVNGPREGFQLVHADGLLGFGYLNDLFCHRARYIGDLVIQLCYALERAGRGARRLDLICQRVDSRAQVVRVRTGLPLREVKRMTRLLCDKIETIDPGFGIEVMTLAATVTEPLAPKSASVLFVFAIHLLQCKLFGRWARPRRRIRHARKRAAAGPASLREDYLSQVQRDSLSRLTDETAGRHP